MAKRTSTGYVFDLSVGGEPMRQEKGGCERGGEDERDVQVWNPSLYTFVFPKAGGVALVTLSLLALKSKSCSGISCHLQGIVPFSPGAVLCVLPEDINSTFSVKG